MRNAVRCLIAGIVIGSSVVVMPAAGNAQDTIPHILVFSGTLGYRHGGIPHMLDVIQHLSDTSHAFTVEHTENVDVFTDPSLYDRIDGVLFLQVTSFGSAPLDDAEKARFLRFFSCGGSFTGIHATSDSGSRGVWQEYHDLIGAQFVAHPHFGSVYSYWRSSDPNSEYAPQVHIDALQNMTFFVEDPGHAATKDAWPGMETFRTSDEIYRYAEDPRANPDLHVLVSMDEESDYWPAPLYGNLPNPRTVAGQLSPWGGYTRHEPVAWTKPFGQGQVFYTNLGHNPETFDRVDFQKHLLGGLGWATSVRPDRACAAGVTP